MSAVTAQEGWGFAKVRAVPDQWGRVVQGAVGAELLARNVSHSSTAPSLYFWQRAGKELDHVLANKSERYALEVKSSPTRGTTPGLDAFCKSFPTAKPLVLGTGGLPLATWFEQRQA